MVNLTVVPVVLVFCRISLQDEISPASLTVGCLRLLGSEAFAFYGPKAGKLRSAHRGVNPCDFGPQEFRTAQIPNRRSYLSQRL